VKRGLPAVVVTTERFNAVAKATLRSQRVPESIVIEIKGNPEFINDEELASVSAQVVTQLVERLTAEHRVKTREVV
jgi:hypothetical protein